MYLEVLLLFVFQIGAHRQVQMAKGEVRGGDTRPEGRETAKTVKEDPKDTGRDSLSGAGVEVIIRFPPK